MRLLQLNVWLEALLALDFNFIADNVIANLVNTHRKRKSIKTLKNGTLSTELWI